MRPLSWGGGGKTEMIPVSKAHRSSPFTLKLCELFCMLALSEINTFLMSSQVAASFPVLCAAGFLYLSPDEFYTSGIWENELQLQ